MVGAVTLVFGVVALCACIVPARRAAQVDPMIVLNQQKLILGPMLLKLS